MRINRSTSVRSLIPSETEEVVLEKDAGLRRKDGYLEDSELHKLWEVHKSTPATDFEARNKILGEFKNMRKRAIMPYENTMVPKPVQEHAALSIVVRAIDSWKPNGGRTLRNHIAGSLFPSGNMTQSAVGKTVRKFSSDGKSITDGRLKVITKARELISEFELENGRPPSDMELGTMLGETPDFIRKLRKNLQKNFTMEHQIDDTFTLPNVLTPEMRDGIRTVYGSLDGRDKEIMQMLMYPHLGGSPPPAHQKEMAQRFGVSDSIINRTKLKIFDLLKNAV